MTELSDNPLVLIVDDNLQNLQVLGSMLKNHGYRPAVAQNGLKALEFVQKKLPELILLDVMMPELDGLETCRRLKRDVRAKHIPVIFITALSGTNDKLQAFQAGGVDYVTKPFIQEEVLARIRVHIDLKRAMERLCRAAETDELTGIHNRRSAYDVLTRELAQHQRQGQGLTLCYLDIDNLKSLNDLFGHAAGDELILTVVDTLRAGIREQDYFFRMGGDEFLLLFPELDLEATEALMDRLHAVAHARWIHDQPVDFSYGCVYCAPDQAWSADELIQRADADMYAAKARKKQACDVGSSTTQAHHRPTRGNGGLA